MIGFVQMATCARGREGLSTILLMFLFAAPVGITAIETVDILVLYTAEAREAAGGTNGITSRIDAALAQANAALSNSLTQTELFLVDSAEMTYTETSNLEIDLERLAGTGDGYMDQVHSLRLESGADVVTLLTGSTDTGNIAGMGYLMSPASGSFAPWAFSVVRQDQVLFYSFIHEIGHHLGCHHDPDNANGQTGAYTNACGHRFTDNGITYRTIMAYAPGTRIGFFSNPSVTYGSSQTGITDQRDNARCIRNTSTIVANFYERPYGDYQLTATALDNRVRLRWPQPTQFNVDTDLVHLRFSTNSYPATTNDGIFVYQGTTNTYVHTNITPHLPHFYSIWFSDDGTNFMIP